MDNDLLKHNVHLKCQQCKLTFQTKEQLVNHAQRFCSNSEYSTLPKLKSKMDEAQYELQKLKVPYRDTLTVNELKDFLQGENPPERQKEIGRMSLEQIRGEILNNKDQYQIMQQQHMAQTEQQMKDQVYQYRKANMNNRKLKREQQELLLLLLADLEKFRDRKSQAQIDLDLISNALRDLDIRSPNSMEQQKKRELNRLKAERDALRFKEDQYHQGLQQLNNIVESLERSKDTQRLQAEQQFQNRGRLQPFSQDDIQMQIDRLTQDQLIMMSQLKGQKDLIDAERNKIMEDLNGVRKETYFNSRKNSTARQSSNQIIFNQNIQQLQDKYSQDLQKLNDFKRDRDLKKDQAPKPVQQVQQNLVSEGLRSPVLHSPLQRKTIDPGYSNTIQHNQRFPADMNYLQNQ